MFDLDDDGMDVIDAAITNRLGNKNEIKLFEQLMVALELMKDDSFDILSAEINNGILFEILTPFPNNLPDKLGELFFNVSTDFNVSCCENNSFAKYFSKHYVITIKYCGIN